MKILVTGAAGFIGFHVCQCLLQRGDDVVGLDNINTYYDVDLKYGRLAVLGIGQEEIEWYKFVQSIGIFPLSFYSDKSGRQAGDADVVR